MNILTGKQLTGDFNSWMKLLCQHLGLRIRIVYWNLFCNFLGSFSLSITKCTPNDVDDFWFGKILKGKQLNINYVFLGS